MSKVNYETEKNNQSYETSVSAVQGGEKRKTPTIEAIELQAYKSKDEKTIADCERVKEIAQEVYDKLQKAGINKSVKYDARPFDAFKTKDGKDVEAGISYVVKIKGDNDKGEKIAFKCNHDENGKLQLNSYATVSAYNSQTNKVFEIPFKETSDITKKILSAVSGNEVTKNKESNKAWEIASAIGYAINMKSPKTTVTYKDGTQAEGKNLFRVEQTEAKNEGDKTYPKVSTFKTEDDKEIQSIAFAPRIGNAEGLKDFKVLIGITTENGEPKVNNIDVMRFVKNGDNTKREIDNLSEPTDLNKYMPENIANSIIEAVALGLEGKEKIFDEIKKNNAEVEKGIKDIEDEVPFDKGAKKKEDKEISLD